MERVSPRAVSSWSRSPGGREFRGVFWVGRIFRAFHDFAFSNSFVDPVSERQRGLGEEDPTASQSAHRELAPTYPHQAYRLVCSHLRNLATASEGDFHKSEIYRGRVRVWATEWDVFHCTPSRGGRGRRAAVDIFRGVFF